MIVSKTPLRISFFGGGTDFPEYFNNNQSLIIGSSINKFVYITINNHINSDNQKIKIFYKNNEFVNNVRLIKHKVIREILTQEKINETIEVHIAADLPSFSGLGTSSAFTVGFKNLINAYKEEKITKEQLAYYSINLERNILKETVGFQDQIHASYGGFNAIYFKSKDKFFIKKINNFEKIKELENNLLLVFTGITRRANDIEKEKFKNMSIKFNLLDKINLIAKRSLQIIESRSNLNLFGELLDETWNIKKRLSNNVTNYIIDQIYNLAKNSGAIGGKLLGAGAGGFILFYVPQKNKKRVMHALSKYKIIDFNFSAKGTEIIKI